ncbi:MAG: AAA family ATPase [Candidatus Parabeggiatoa sp.]|nr:AAA family ATPase [Candidatus Parabeggiatoa sp.]
MQLNKLILKGYKSIKQTEIELTHLNVFIGANGAGKSNFISFFHLLNAIINEQLRIFVPKNGFADAFLHYGRKHTQAIEAHLKLGKHGYQFRLEPTADNRFIFTDESLTITTRILYNKELDRHDADPQKQEVTHLGLGHSESNLSQFENNSLAQRILPIIKHWQVYHFHDTSRTALVKQIGSIHDHAYLREDASNLAAFLYKLKLKHEKQYRSICLTVQKVAPFFGDFILEPTLEDSASILLKWHEKEGDFPFTAHHLSDGTLRLICLATVLLQPQPPTTIIIDEPELGLHPFAINILGALIRRFSKSKQIILATQSVNFLDQFQPEDVIVTQRMNEASLFKRLNAAELEKWLEEYSLSELWEKNYFNGRPS